MRPALTALASIVVLAVAGCGGSDGGAPAVEDEAAAVQELASLEPLVARFDADAGKARLLLILSPT